jgi:hypothetical protein
MRASVPLGTIPGMNPEPAQLAVQLTPEQLAFAQSQHAVPGKPAFVRRRAVFMYREDRLGAWRWLIDSTGHILESERFSRR